MSDYSFYLTPRVWGKLDAMVANRCATCGKPRHLCPMNRGGRLDSMTTVVYDTKVLAFMAENDIDWGSVPATDRARIYQQARRAYNAIAGARSEIRRASRWQGIKEPKVNTVLRFRKTFSRNPNVRYQYTALRAGDGLWYLSGRNHSQGSGLGWRSLCDFIGDEKVERARGWDEIAPLLPEWPF